MARKFFFVCFGLLCLSLAYQIGASRAVAQGSGEVVGGMLSGLTNSLCVATSDGRIYQRAHTGAMEPWTLTRAVPVSSPVTAIAVLSTASGTPDFVLMCENGTVYDCEGTAGPIAVSNVFAGGPVSSPSTSWGSLKARYR